MNTGKGMVTLVRAFPVCHTHAMEIPALAHRYKHHRFPAEIISHGVWLYYRLHLSYRDVQELLFARGIAVTHEAHGAELGRGYSLMPPHTWAAILAARTPARRRG